MLKPFILAIGLSVSLNALANYEGKGLEVCQDANADNCIVTTFNQPAQPDASKQKSDASTEDKVKAQADVNIQFKYSDAKGNGKAEYLNNNQTLRSGDKFTIAIEAKDDVYLYLFHFDAHQQLNELVSLTTAHDDNFLKAGTKLLLPSATQHFKLDDNAGIETIHTIVSTQPLTDLYAKYTQAIKGETLTALVQRQGGEGFLAGKTAKGIVIEDDKTPATAKADDSQAADKTALANTGRTVVCLAETIACRDSFMINHVK